ncbi:MAG: response regulator transcription factor [Caulobacterales bacterium]
MVTAHRHHIVVAEDDAAIRELLTIRLEQAGHLVTAARDGHEALAAIRAQRPDCVILDVGMPGLDGFGVLRELQADPTLRDIPALVLTANDAFDDVRKATSLGAKDYMTKPFDAARLLSRIARLNVVRDRKRLHFGEY